ncbi:uncharacterized protein [Physcomitrium patens]|uniref:Uncharacterized protein n=1 Tax=Physcomitrium patens TaxID=3218 RepID=A0A2K1IMQ3_PHYPA|nr:uncharacterized protein LOC112275253 [Physcomitrium patens]XP_024361241.1 uncharacterized protein LOC112275253 [Physcomitrium patens]XP_024361242.1 uncharacterized protein LOC112275253 [Physcomitrium patens]PNR30553.1 hypothetical protein PHYPA_026869 [Physcomitrium patens]|eukprot:XP_024361239.1 uncharacterized protein LOC112275253 [Physcomitrella patens]
MEPPVLPAGPTLRRAATFSYRQERALQDVNGRANGLNKSQDHLSTAKSTADGRNVTRLLKQFSAVPSRYAAPLASKKNLSTTADKPQTGQANMTKLPFITGRAAPSHQRKPSGDSLNSSQPAMVFSASVREPKADTSAKKVAANSSSLGAKRPRVGTKTSMVEQKSQVAARAPRVYSLDKGGCWCSKNGSVRGPAEASAAGSVSVLYSAAHWVHLIKLAEGEKKNDVVVDLLRVAVRLKAEPREMVKVELKRYGEGHPSDEVVQQLVEECEGVAGVSVSSTTIEGGEEGESISEESNGSAAVLSNGDSGAACVSKITIVAPVVSENGGAVTKDVAAKRPHFMGRMLARSATFSVVDPNSKSVHAKAEYGRKLEKTLEFLASQAVAHSPGNAGDSGRPCASESPKPSLASVAEVNTTPKSRSKFEVQSQGDIEVSETLPTLVTDLASPSSNLDEIATSNIDVASNIVDMVPKPGSLFCLESESAISSCISVAEAGPGPESPVANGNADKPVDSLSEWLDVESPAMCSPEIQSARTEVKQIEVDALTSEVVSHSLPPKAAEVSESPLSDGPHRRRKSWQGSGNLSTTPFAEKPSRSHKHTLSADAAILNVRCGGERSLLSVVDKVKLFTVLAESGGVTSTPEENSLSGSEEIVEDKEIDEPKQSTGANGYFSQTVKDEVRELESPVESVIDTNPSETPVGSETIVVAEPNTAQNNGFNAPVTTPVKVSSRRKTLKGDTVPIPATPSAATPRESGNGVIPRAGHRRASSVGYMTPRGPFDGVVACSPFGDNGGSPSSHSSNAKSQRVSRGYREVTPRMNLPKPSWIAVVEREMKGSKLKDLLAAQLPEVVSPLSEYLEAQMGNQNRDPENGTFGAVDKCVSSTCSPAKSYMRMTRSSARKQAVSKEEQNEGCGELKPSPKPKYPGESEQDADTSTTGFRTPGSAVRRSARIQNKVQSKRNVLFKEESSTMM